VPMRSELLRIFLAEKNHEAAWDTFVGGPVSTQLWSQMAEVRGMSHPYDAIALYHRLLPVAAESGSYKARYEEAFAVVRAIGMLRTKLGERAAFAAELAEIRATYRAKRNFIKLLDTLS